MHIIAEEVQDCIDSIEYDIEGERNDGYGGVCISMEDYPEILSNKNFLNEVISYVLENYTNVRFFENEYNDNGAYVGKLLSFDFE